MIASDVLSKYPIILKESIRNLYKDKKQMGVLFEDEYKFDLFP